MENLPSAQISTEADVSTWYVRIKTRFQARMTLRPRWHCLMSCHLAHRRSASAYKNDSQNRMCRCRLRCNFQNASELLFIERRGFVNRGIANTLATNGSYRPFVFLERNQFHWSTGVLRLTSSELTAYDPRRYTDTLLFTRSAFLERKSHPARSELASTPCVGPKVITRYSWSARDSLDSVSSRQRLHWKSSNRLPISSLTYVIFNN